MKQEKAHIQDILDRGHSKALRDELIAYVDNTPKRMKALMSFFFHDEWRYNQISAWAVGVIGEKQPKLLQPYLNKMVTNLEHAKHDAVIRNTIRTFQVIDFDEELEGQVYDICMAYLLDLKQPIAIRCFSITALSRIADKHPELQAELVLTVREFYDIGSAGYRSRAKKIFRKYE